MVRELESTLRRTRTGLLTAAALLPLAFTPHGAAAETKRVFVIPPIQWDPTITRDRPAQIHGPTELGRLTGGVVWGLSPAQVNARLSAPVGGLDPATLPFANEYPEEIRYFWTRLDTARELREGMGACAGANSYVVFLFRSRGLFRVSWRLLPDADCSSPRAAAEDVFARYLALDQAAALTTHYRAGKAEVVEVTDPNASYLIPIRWENRRRR